MSHPLPHPVRELLSSFACRLDDGLQAEAHKVAVATAVHPAFQARWVESTVTRALIAAKAAPLGGNGLCVEELGSGGIEVYSTLDGVKRRFRLKRAVRDQHGSLDVRVSSDSLLAVSAERQASLFDPEVEPEPAATVQRWVLAYILDPSTRTLREISAARIIGFATHHSPFRLALADIMRIPHNLPLPPRFDPKQDEEDLGMDDGQEEEGGGEAAG